MKKMIRKNQEASKRRIRKRLERAVRPNETRPTLMARNIRYETAGRRRGISCGGIGALHLLARKTGLIRRLDKQVEVLKLHKPYFESDHILNIAYNQMCGGKVIEDIELRRNDEVYLDALGAESIPDPTTAGDFCRRFGGPQIEALQEAINQTRVEVWKRQGEQFFEQTARIDADGTLVSTEGECKAGMDISHKGIWGYHPLMVSLANTQEPLYLLNRSGNRPSHEGAKPYLDKAISLCRQAGFRKMLLRGDTDFSLTKHFDHWDDQEGVKFVFGLDASSTMKQGAEGLEQEEYEELVRRAQRQIKTEPRERPENVKDRIVRERRFKNIRLNREEVAEFAYQPRACKRAYRVVVVRKNLTVEKGEEALFDELRYFFYISNDREMSAAQIVAEACGRCNQENLIEQLKNGVRALHAPVNSLNANWAYMVMAALAWSLKAWMGLLLPVHPRWRDKHLQEKQRLVRMEFRTFVQTFVLMPCLIVRTARRIVYRMLSWSPHQYLFWRFLDAVQT